MARSHVRAGSPLSYEPDPVQYSIPTCRHCSIFPTQPPPTSAYFYKDIPLIKEESSVNSQRRVIINRREIIYGNTPIGLRRKELEKMAAEQNVDISTICHNLISLTNEDRFLFLQNYYEKLNNESNIFFEHFNTYKIYSDEDLKQQKSEHLASEHSEVFQSRRKKLKSLDTARNNRTINGRINSDRNDNFDSDDDTGSVQTDHSTNRPSTSQMSRFTTVHSTNRPSTSQMSRFTKSGSNLPTKNDITPVKNRDIQPPLTCNTEDTTSVTQNNNESVINSIFFDDSQSQLKKILKEKANKNKSPSPKKYNTMMETLLFG